MNRVSKLFWPVQTVPKNAVIKNVEATSRSQRLMTDMGLIRSSNNGTFQILPIAQRAIDKCINLLNHSMQNVGGQKLSLPVLTASALWKKSGRLDGDITEFFLIHDRQNKQFLLSPTHEEAVTAMLASISPISYRQLPLKFYQIGPKFRDELKPRLGLIRAKEFLMKDMYSFDCTETAAKETYQHVTDAYTGFFEKLQVPFVRVKACTGMMGGGLSHEFHYLSPTGEDKLFQCNKCGLASNVEVSGELSVCSNCNGKEIVEQRGIEVGHTFLLGDTYSGALGATFLDTKGKPQSLLMGCYGIGVTRLIASALEVLSTDKELRWPTLLAPYDVCVIGPKQGSKEQHIGDVVENELCKAICGISGAHEVLNDDRKYLTIGKRLMEAKRLGIPLIIVIGAKSTENPPKLELHSNGEITEVEATAVLQHVTTYTQMKMNILMKEPDATANENQSIRTSQV